MNCEACGKAEAVVRSTSVVGGKMVRQRLCAACDAAKGFVVEPESFPASPTMSELLPGALKEILQTGLELAERTSASKKRTCPQCGISPAEFEKRGRLGCPHDYVAFEEDLGKLLLKIHGKDVHVGRTPESVKRRQGRKRFVRERVEALKKQLETAVESERFEEAVSLRDRIKELEKAGGEDSA